MGGRVLSSQVYAGDIFPGLNRGYRAQENDETGSQRG